MEIGQFIQAVLVMILALVLLFGVLFWIFRLLNSDKLKFWLKYKLFKSKYDPKTIEYVYEAINRGMTKNQLHKHLLLSNQVNKKQVKEFLYIYDQVNHKVKRGYSKDNGRHGSINKSA